MIGMAPGTEQRFSVYLGGDKLADFVKRPISTPAPEGTIAFLDGLTEKGNLGRQVGIFKDGQWHNDRGGRSLRIKPLTWTALADAEPQRGG